MRGTRHLNHQKHSHRSAWIETDVSIGWKTGASPCDCRRNLRNAFEPLRAAFRDTGSGIGTSAITCRF